MMQFDKIISHRMLLILALLLAAAIQLPVYAQQVVTGTVTDGDGETIPGATVLVKGTTTGTTTDFDGKYRIQASVGDVLVFSFVGLERKEVKVGANTILDLSLDQSDGELDEVIVVGFGIKQEKAAVVGAISQVSGESIQRVKMGGSVENSLQGALPGLTVIQSDPTPGEEAIGGLSVSIRGVSSMGSNTPLYIVDGVERQFSNLDPNEIESVSILKDASATALYGVRGANGVVIINTKRGVDGKIQLEYSSQVSYKEPTILPEYMNAYETLTLRNEAYRNDGNWDQIVSDEVLNHYRDQDLPYLYPDTDWMDYLYGHGWDHQHNLNARGGNDFVRYFVSVGYLEEGDIMNTANAFPYDFDDINAGYNHKRFNFRNNLDFSITESTELSISLGGNIKIWRKPQDTYTQENWFEPVTALPYYPAEALELYPDDVIPYDQSGVRPYIDPAQGEVRLSWNGSWGFWRNKQNEILSDIKLAQKLDFITEGLSVTGLYSYNSQVRYQKNYDYPNYFGYYLDPETQEWSRYNRYPGSLDYDTPNSPLVVDNGEFIASSLKSHWMQGSLDYNRAFGKHDVSVSGIFQRRQVADGIAVFPSYQESWIGRGTYSYGGKYFLEASVAHSGSEKFAPGLRFGTFPAFAGGWMLSEEEFFDPLKKVLSTFKIRYSWGKVGSDEGIPRWLYRSTYSQDVDTWAVLGFPRVANNIINEGPVPVYDATWEEALKQNLGFEMGFLNGQYTLNVDLYNERRTSVLQTRQSVPAYVGTTDIRQNIGETKSHGIEVELGINKPIGQNMFLWATINMAATENRVVYYDESANVPFNLKAEGKPVDIAQRLGSYTPGTGIVNNGYYQDFEELFMLPTAGGSPIVGDLKFIDFNGDGNVDEQDYVVSEYPLTPLVNWNSTVGFDYKNWSISAQVYGISNVARPMRQGGMFFLFPFSQNKNNAYTVHADHWTPQNTDAEFPAVHSQAVNQYNYQISQFSMVDGKYIRLRNVRLGYKLDADFLGAVGMRELNIALIGTNLYTWRKRDWGGDPEGFNFGQDFGAYPQLKRYTLEIRAFF